MGLDQVFENYYEAVKPFSHGKPLDLAVGQIAWVPTTFINQIPQILEIERAASSEHNNIKYRINNMTASHFIKRGQLPVAGMPLSDNEEYLATKAKKRPCILIAKSPNLLKNKEFTEAAENKKHVTNCHGLFLPIFGSQSAEHKGGFSRTMILRTKVLMYPHFFYIKSGTAKGCITDFAIDEGVARIDCLFSSCLHVPGVTPTDVKLVQPVLSLLTNYVHRFIKAPMHPDNENALNEALELLSLYWDDLQTTTQ